MTLQEMSAEYEAAAERLRLRLMTLRRRLRSERDPFAKRLLRQRIAALEPMLTEMNTLAELTARYYDRGYHSDEDYRI